MDFNVINRPYSEILEWLNYYQQNNNEASWLAMQHLLQTANGRYTFGDANLNNLVNVETIGFRDWLRQNWGGPQ